MKLLLTSAGLSNRSIAKALLDLAGKPFAQLKLAFVPTAANVEAGDKGWFIDDLNNCQKLGFAQIDIVDISAIPEAMWKLRLEEADILFFEGGNDFHLIYWLNKSGLKAMLPEMLKTKIYVGLSAGSMVAAQNMSITHSKKIYYGDASEQKYNDETGLGFVAFQIRPHFNSPDFPKANAKYLAEMAKEIPEPIYALDDNSALKVVDGEVEIISEGEWKRFN